MMSNYPPRLLALSEKCPLAMQQREYWSIRDFALVKEVGSGAASTVYYALCRKSCLPVAIKVYNKAKLTKLNRKQVEREINIHSSLNHPHVIDFYAAFEDGEMIYLVMEYAIGGDLFDEVKKRGGRLAEHEVVQNIMYPYLCALAYLHGRGYIHRDIKPENTVFTRDHVLKLTDFGLAINSQEERPVTRLGTLDYMSPEVLRCPDKHMPEDNKEREDLEYSSAVDAWAMGVLAYELIVGRPPFGMSSREATMKAITQCQPNFPEWLSPAATHFICTALNKAPAYRASVLQLLQHPWITSYIRPVPIPTPSPQAMLAQQPCGLEYQVANHLQLTSSQKQISTTFSSTCQSNSSGTPNQGLTLLEAWQAATQGQATPPARAAWPDMPPAKRVLTRCMSSYAAEGCKAPLLGENSTSGIFKPSLQAKAHDLSYWCTDGIGFGDDPLALATTSFSPQQLSRSGSSSMQTPSAESEQIQHVPKDLYNKSYLDDLKAMLECGRPNASSARGLTKGMSRSFCFKRRTPDVDGPQCVAQVSLESLQMQQMQVQAGLNSPLVQALQAAQSSGGSQHAPRPAAPGSAPSRLSKMKRVHQMSVSLPGTAPLPGLSSPFANEQTMMAVDRQGSSASGLGSPLTSYYQPAIKQVASPLLSSAVASMDELCLNSQHMGLASPTSTTSTHTVMAMPGQPTIADIRSHPLVSPLHSPMYSRQGSSDLSILAADFQSHADSLLSGMSSINWSQVFAQAQTGGYPATAVPVNGYSGVSAAGHHSGHGTPQVSRLANSSTNSCVRPISTSMAAAVMPAGLSPAPIVSRGLSLHSQATQGAVPQPAFVLGKHHSFHHHSGGSGHVTTAPVHLVPHAMLYSHSTGCCEPSVPEHQPLVNAQCPAAAHRAPARNLSVPNLNALFQSMPVNPSPLGLHASRNRASQMSDATMESLLGMPLLDLDATLLIQQ